MSDQVFFSFDLRVEKDATTVISRQKKGFAIHEDALVRACKDYLKPLIGYLRGWPPVGVYSFAYESSAHITD